MKTRLELIEKGLIEALLQKQVSKTYFLISERCYINNQMFHSLNYKRKGKINSYTICFESNQREHYGLIKIFLIYENKIYAFVKKYHIENEKFRHMFPVNCTGSLFNKNNLDIKNLKEIFLEF